MARAKPTVTYKKKDQVAWISMNRPEFNNAQNGKMTYDLGHRSSFHFEHY